jgi:hypothetical protein
MVFRKRRDGTYLEVPPLRRIVPYLMPTRLEATVYYQQRIEAEGLVAWLEAANAGRSADERFTLFHVVLAAVARTIRLRPEANRFVVGRRTYEHTDISVAFMVKVAMTDDAPESQARIVFTGRESVDEVRAMVREAVHREHREEASGDDRLIDFFASWPRPVLNQVVRAVRSLDYHNALPRRLVDAIPLYTSVYVVNTGSIGVDAPLHHLYELGTASFFLAIGRLGPQPVVDERGEVVARTCLDVTYTLDERASDGFYFARTAEVFRRLVADPRLLEDPDPTVERILSGPNP